MLFKIIWYLDRIGPDYRPAHAHSDTLSFILHHNGKPIFVDTGISTYEANERRSDERSTTAHNTVMYDSIEQSETWKAFRVGRRAKPKIIKEQQDFMKASHDGYHHLGVTHTREWAFEENCLRLIDLVEGKTEEKSTAFFHVHPGIKPEKKSEHVFQIDNIKLSLLGEIKSRIVKWHYAQGYNILKMGYKIEVVFEDKLESRISY